MSVEDNCFVVAISRAKCSALGSLWLKNGISSRTLRLDVELRNPFQALPPCALKNFPQGPGSDGDYSERGCVERVDVVTACPKCCFLWRTLVQTHEYARVSELRCLLERQKDVLYCIIWSPWSEFVS